MHLPSEGYVSTSMKSKDGVEPTTSNHSNNAGIHVAHVIVKHGDNPRCPLVRGQSNTTERNPVIHINKCSENTTLQDRGNHYTHHIYCKTQHESSSAESSTFYQGATDVQDPDQNDVKNV